LSKTAPGTDAPRVAPTEEKAKSNRKFVLVEEPDSPVLLADMPVDTKYVAAPSAVTDQKIDRPITLGASQLVAMRSVMARRQRGGKGKSGQIFRPKTCFRSMSAGPSGSAWFPVINLQPNNTSIVTEATQWAALFDEARCIGFDVYARIYGSASTTLTSGAWAFVYDVCNASAYTSVVGTLISEQVCGPTAFNVAVSDVAVNVENRSGYVHKKFMCRPMNPTAGAGTANENVGNDWFGTSDQNATVGYLKFAADAQAASALALDAMIVYHMEYRSRS